jgi:hypothetical protein
MAARRDLNFIVKKRFLGDWVDWYGNDQYPAQGQAKGLRAFKWLLDKIELHCGFWRLRSSIWQIPISITRSR